MSSRASSVPISWGWVVTEKESAGLAEKLIADSDKGELATGMLIPPGQAALHWDQKRWRNCRPISSLPSHTGVPTTTTTGPGRVQGAHSVTAAGRMSNPQSQRHV